MQASVHIRGESAHTNLPLWTYFTAELRAEGKVSGCKVLSCSCMRRAYVAGMRCTKLGGVCQGLSCTSIRRLTCFAFHPFPMLSALV